MTEQILYSPQNPSEQNQSGIVQTSLNSGLDSDLCQAFQATYAQLSEQILGQDYLVERLLIALLADGHLLVEGAPGLAKTTAIKALSSLIEGDFQRIQFTPDLLPSDLTGTEVYRPQTGEFLFQKGPLFHNLVLADEINRAPAKVQSALLEAMGEKQITVGQSTYPLARLFLVMATQNPIEQEGTYPLPEAQLDRFLMHVKIDYPKAPVEQAILRLSQQQALQKLTQQTPTANTAIAPKKLTAEQIHQAQQQLFALYMAPDLEQYLLALILTTRQVQQTERPAKSQAERLGAWIEFGASPRATLALDRCARAKAFLAGRDYVLPEDIQAVLPDVLRHRLILSFEAQAQGIDVEQVVEQLLAAVPAP